MPDTKTETVTPEQNSPQPMPPVKTHGFLKFLIAILLIAAIVLSVIKIVDCARNPENKDGLTHIASRSARKSDLAMQDPENLIELLLLGQIIFIPLSDIKNLELEFRLYNSSNNLIFSKVSNVGNVYENTKFYIYFSPPEMTQITLILPSIKNDDWAVIGGTVSYFA